MAPEREYSGRDVVDKLGVKAGHAVRIADLAGVVDGELRNRIVGRTGAGEAGEGTPLDIAVVGIDASVDPAAILAAWKGQLKPSGGIWLLTPKRSHPGYVNQDRLIEAGAVAGVVDNKICSVSEAVSAMRFVIRRRDRRLHE